MGEPNEGRYCAAEDPKVTRHAMGDPDESGARGAVEGAEVAGRGHDDPRQIPDGDWGAGGEVAGAATRWAVPGDLAAWSGATTGGDGPEVEGHVLGEFPRPIRR